MFDQPTPPDALLIPASRLRDICRQVGLAVERRTSIPVLETVLIEATATGTTFRSTVAKALREARAVAEHYRDMCGECNWPEEAVIVGGNVANDIAAGISAMIPEVKP